MNFDNVNLLTLDDRHYTIPLKLGSKMRFDQALDKGKIS